MICSKSLKEFIKDKSNLKSNLFILNSSDFITLKYSSEYIESFLKKSNLNNEFLLGKLYIDDKNLFFEKVSSFIFGSLFDEPINKDVILTIKIIGWDVDDDSIDYLNKLLVSHTNNMFIIVVSESIKPLSIKHKYIIDYNLNSKQEIIKQNLDWAISIYKVLSKDSNIKITRSDLYDIVNNFSSRKRILETIKLELEGIKYEDNAIGLRGLLEKYSNKEKIKLALLLNNKHCSSRSLGISVTYTLVSTAVKKLFNVFLTVISLLNKNKINRLFLSKNIFLIGKLCI